MRPSTVDCSTKRGVERYCRRQAGYDQHNCNKMGHVARKSRSQNPFLSIGKTIITKIVGNVTLFLDLKIFGKLVSVVDTSGLASSSYVVLKTRSEQALVQPGRYETLSLTHCTAKERVSDLGFNIAVTLFRSHSDENKVHQARWLDLSTKSCM